MTPSIVIVSNRLPISVKRNDSGELEFYPSVGGLATGLASYVNDRRNKWIGWPGIATDDLSEADQVTITNELIKHNCYPVFLKQKQLNDYYNGYSNSILWPLFHDLSADFSKHETYFKAYKAVNTAFAEAVLALSAKGSTIWVHDYQLLLLPALLRVARPKDKIGFFLHIPFPPLNYFQELPSAKLLLAGMLGSDLLGLHTRNYVKNFLAACTALTDEIVEDNQIILGDHVARITDFPMGIDYDRFTRARELPAVKKEYRKHQKKYKGLKVILTVERLDPTKAFVERLEAYYEFLRRSPQLHRKVIMVMLAVPSRTDIEEYKQLKGRVDQLVAAINDQFGTARWKPVDFLYTSMPVEYVVALYQIADIAFITPLRDGMNLVAKEFIASRPGRDGVLILSSTAGAAQELTDALLVNPKRKSSLVEALSSAFTMPKLELRRRIGNMQEQVSTRTVQHWAGSFMKTLQQPLPGRIPHVTRRLTPDRRRDVVGSYWAARERLILLDYDGTLATFVDNPAHARPDSTLYHLIAQLACIPANHVAIISGRSKADLQAWFPSDMTVTLVAEHGAQMRLRDKKNWKRLTEVPSAEWQAEVAPMMEKYAVKTPGAFIEVKDFSITWHYRKASPYYAQKHLVILRRLLRPVAKRYNLTINNGKMMLEVKPTDVHKGVQAAQFVRITTDFIMAIGDDYTDEDMFENLPITAYSIKVGRGRTLARYRLASVDEVQKLLKRLAK